jgi:TonB family protein
VAYQCLTGHVPFDGEDSFSIGYKHIMEELPVPPLENADQRELFTVIQKMMAKKAEDRFQTAEDVVHALEALGGPSARVSLADLATMPTRAIEPMRAPPPAISIAATTPLPRASASMGVPADVAAAAAAKAAAPAPPAAPVKGKLGPRPAPKGKSKAPFYALGGVAVVAVGLGGYMLFGRAAPVEVAVQPPADTTRPVAATPDTAKARADSIAAHAAAPAPASHAPASRPSQPPASVPSGPPGTLSLAGAIPSGARITVDSRSGSAHEKLPPGRHTLRVEAQGFQRYEAQVDIASGRVTSHTVTLVPATSAAPPAAASPQATSAAPSADCANPSIGVLNPQNACYNVRPSARTPPLAVAPSSCTGTVTPTTVLLKVSATGDVANASSSSPGSNCAAFNAAALAVARDLSFTPATKGGAPVEAWIKLSIRPQPH